jgi:hypothetical protein
MSDEQQSEPREPKYEACKRLEKEGRLIAFRLRQAHYRSPVGGKLSRDEAFYAALKEFPKT